MPSVARILIALLLLAALALLLGGVFSLIKRRRRRDRWVATAPFPEKWRRILRRNMPVYHRLPDTLRAALELKIKAFLSTTTFEACGGLASVPDEMAVTVAGYACLLVAGRPGATTYPKLSTILMYPDSFFSTAPARGDGPAGVRAADGEYRLGESDARGVVALSWLEIRNNAVFSGNGRNVVLHEFAHQLDGEDSAVDGVPWLPTREARAAWRRDMGAAYAKLRDEGENGVLDTYGAKEPAELFAVATEAFFEDAHRFRDQNPDIHGHFVKYFGLDPARW